MLSSPTTPPLIQLYSKKANVCEGPWFVKYYTINFSYIIQPFNHLKVRYYLHLTSEKSEAQASFIAYPWSHDSYVALDRVQVTLAPNFSLNPPTCLPAGGQMNKHVVHLYNRVLLGHKEEWSTDTRPKKWRGLKNILQSEKVRYKRSYVVWLHL